MSATTSRRRFLQGAAAAAAAATVACGGDQATTQPPPTTPGNATGGAPAPAPAPGPEGTVGLLADPEAVVASKYIRNPMFGDQTLAGKSNSTFLLYGLLVVDFGGKELLVPNSGGLTGIGVHQHTPKLWIRESQVQSGSTSADGFALVSALKFSFWNITNLNVSIEALDSVGAVLPPQSGDLDWRDDPNHPWTNKKWVRCLKELTNKDMTTDRNNTALVSARMEMLKGSVTPIPPTTDLGRNNVWKVTKFDGNPMVKATTDSMIWRREYAGTAASYRITLKPMAGTGNKVVNVNANNKALVAAVTSSMNMKPADPNSLTDTKAYARLLQAGDPNTHPTPVVNGVALATAASGSDGHCECGCN